MAPARGRTALVTAAEAGRLIEVEQILEGGTDVNEQDAYGETALHLACMAGQLDVVRMLVVEQQARMDVRNMEGWVPMIWGIVRGHTDIVKFLAERGSSLQWRTCLGWTPLHFAAMQSNVELVDWMLSEGSDALATGEDGCMPGDCASHPDVRKTLFKTVTHMKYSAGAAPAAVDHFLASHRMAHILDQDDMSAYHPSRHASAAGDAAPFDPCRYGCADQQQRAACGRGSTQGEAAGSGGANDMASGDKQDFSSRPDTVTASRASSKDVRGATAAQTCTTDQNVQATTSDVASKDQQAPSEDASMQPSAMMALRASDPHSAASKVSADHFTTPRPAAGTGSEPHPLQTTGRASNSHSSAIAALHESGDRGAAEVMPSGLALLRADSGIERKWSAILSRPDSELAVDATADSASSGGPTHAKHSTASVTLSGASCQIQPEAKESHQLDAHGAKESGVVTVGSGGHSNPGPCLHNSGDIASEQQIIAEFLQQQA